MSAAIAERFKFADLDDAAKQRAIEWYCDCEQQEFDGAYVIADAVICLGFLGIDVDTDRKGKPNVWWCIGEGAAFAGGWKASDMDLAGLAEFAPQDTMLFGIGGQLMAVLLRWPQASCGIGHSNSRFGGVPRMNIDEDDGIEQDDYSDQELHDALQVCVDLVGDWIHTQIEAEYDSRTSDEACIDSIEANDYDFDEMGRVLP